MTRSAVSPGTLAITDDTDQQARTGRDAAATVATLSRDTASANEFYEPLKYSQYNADAAYRDFMWNSVGINYAPLANASAQARVLYEQRETERLARDVKSLLTGMIPGVMAIGAGTVLNRSPAVKSPASGEMGALSQAAKLGDVGATSVAKGVVGETHNAASYAGLKLDLQTT